MNLSSNDLFLNVFNEIFFKSLLGDCSLKKYQQSIIIWTSYVMSYSFRMNVSMNVKFNLLLVSKCLDYFLEEDYDAFCLSYMFTYRDFEMGTLGLAWTGDLKNAGGVCERNGVQYFVTYFTPCNFQHS